MIVVDSDFSALEGTNCYCSEESAAQIRQAISGLPLCAVHLIGTGDYHYISLFWLERINEPFTLVLFDNHPDDQPTAFSPDTLSCGSWVAEARKLPFCKSTVWISSSPDCTGVRRTFAPLIPPPAAPAVPPFTWSRATTGSWTPVQSGEAPAIYLSIDLDVLSTEYARTDWDQGSMTLEELVTEIEEIKKSTRILGVDICGGLTSQKGATDEDLAINTRTTDALISLFSR